MKLAKLVNLKDILVHYQCPLKSSFIATRAKLVEVLVFINFGLAVRKVVDSTSTTDQAVFIEI